MIANSTSNPSGEAWTWQSCRSDGSGCIPFGQGRHLGTGDASPGTVFTATSSRGETASSPIWRGSPSVARLPSVRGARRARALVEPILGAWIGGWADDRDVMQLAACATAGGRRCTTLTHEHFPNGCSSGAAVVDPVFVGYYLRVAHRRRGSGEGVAAFGVGTPYTADVLRSGPTTAVAIVGKIQPSTRPRRTSCGPPPIVCPPRAVRSACITTPTASLTRGGAAHVRCIRRCTVTLRAEVGRRVFRVAKSLRADGAAVLQLPRSAETALRNTPVRLRLTVNRRERLTRVVTLKRV